MASEASFKNSHETRSDHALEKRQARKNMHQQRHSTKYLFVPVESKSAFSLTHLARQFYDTVCVQDNERKRTIYSSASLHTLCANLALQYITECMI